MVERTTHGRPGTNVVRYQRHVCVLAVAGRNNSRTSQRHFVCFSFFSFGGRLRRQWWHRMYFGVFWLVCALHCILFLVSVVVVVVCCYVILPNCNRSCIAVRNGDDHDGHVGDHDSDDDGLFDLM